MRCESLRMFDIIDFHTHPFLCDEENVCFYKDTVKMTTTTKVEDMDAEGISYFCGSVVRRNYHNFNDIHTLNNNALKLREIYKGRYIPGIHVHPTRFVM